MGRLRVVRLISSTTAENKPGFKVLGCSPQLRKRNGGVCPMPGKEVTACTSGVLIAHDLVEHQNGVQGIGPVWDELEALGGIAHVRAPWGANRSEVLSWAEFEPGTDYARTLWERLAGDIAWFYDAWLSEGGGGMTARGEVPAYYDPSKPWRSAWAYAVREARDRLQGEFDEGTWEAYTHMARTCMTQGYENMGLRFGHSREGASRKLWLNIRDAVANELPKIEGEGMAWGLAFDEGTGEVRCWRERA